MSTVNAAWLFEVDHVENWAYANAVFSPEECAKIIEMGKAAGLIAGGLDPANIVDTEIRNSQISWFYPHEDTAWIFGRLTSVLRQMNEQYFKFDVYGFTEGIQFSRYDAPSGFYEKHIDRGMHMATRKLSVSVQLSESTEYKGGDVMLHYKKDPVIAPKDQGTAVIFPSYTLHEVTPTTEGTRYSLVAWATGHPFK